MTNGAILYKVCKGLVGCERFMAGNWKISPPDYREGIFVVEDEYTWYTLFPDGHREGHGTEIHNDLSVEVVEDFLAVLAGAVGKLRLRNRQIRDLRRQLRK